MGAAFLVWGVRWAGGVALDPPPLPLLLLFPVPPLVVGGWCDSWGLTGLVPAGVP